MAGTAIMALGDGWLDNGTATVTSGTVTIGDSTRLECGFWWPQQYEFTYPYTWIYPVVSSPARPIKLTMAEVNQLRKAAKGDKSLKAILEKFTPQIEVVVDFG